MNSQLKVRLSGLLQRCVCGSEDAIFYEIHDIPVLACNACGVMRQHLEGYTKADYFNYYRDEYHSKAQTDIGLTAYSERYEHDCKIAKQRIAIYNEIMQLSEGATCLDIGSSNNAFVDSMNEEGYKCSGIEIGEEGRKHLDTTYTEDLLELCLPSSSFDLVTMHDVFEHFINPVHYLNECARIIKQRGYLVIDLPNYFVEEGLHHWRPVQHLWFFNEFQTIQLISKYGFRVVSVRHPIASKLVFYCERV